MNKMELEKNRLDLAYKRNLQIMNVFLTIGAGTIIAYFAGFILNPERLFQYSTIIVIISILTYIIYSIFDEKLKNISN